MFAVDLDVFQIAAEGDCRTHLEWLTSVYGRYAVQQFFEKTTRGIAGDGFLLAYIGTEMSTKVDPIAVKKAINGFRGLGFIINTVGLGWDGTKAIIEIPAEEYLLCN
jgi:hypothetical protein